ncbi:enhancer of split m8 protein [Drosophila grimshawi]|uniref:GH19459 n=1 Tax=Drosophila grimshawi TaxID=7222 RepID=B4JGJ2_DROGR|nr:enhancer of split m8 protein [Drosophila grimshawi]EDV93689.1 GH19459 [Drosophila grimshawi]
MEYSSKTEIYQKVKKPLLERQRRARINKCLDTLKTLVADLRGDDGILRMDKAEMLESAVVFMRQQKMGKSVAATATATPTTKTTTATTTSPAMPLENFRNGYMNAVNEVSRVMASTPGMSVDLGKSVMSHLGRIYKNLQQFHKAQTMSESESELSMNCNSAPLSPASSGYHSDCESPAPSPMPVEAEKLWRPW